MAEEHTPEGESERKAYARAVHKICGYYKWSIADFQACPWWLIKELSAILDEREADMSQFIGYEESSMFKNMKRMFPPGKD